MNSNNQQQQVANADHFWRPAPARQNQLASDVVREQLFDSIDLREIRLRGWQKQSTTTKGAVLNMIHSEMLHTIDYVPGQEIIKSLGTVGAIGFPSLEGAEVTLAQKAEKLGADAVVGVQFNQNSESGFVSAFGTAVLFRR